MDDKLDTGNLCEKYTFCQMFTLKYCNVNYTSDIGASEIKQAPLSVDKTQILKGNKWTFSCLKYL